tara:strand:+ start:3869 stop:4795 length:927 start_codon:yes stop_codon:yes gene_type:complete
MLNKNILKNKFNGEILFDEKMSNHTSYGVGGKVNAYIRPKDKTELIDIIKLVHKNKCKVYYLGSGSNLLVNDKDIDCYVISPTKAIKSLIIKDNIIQADAGVMLGKLVKESIKNRLTGLESLAGVPGTLGGALKMNAGAWGSEISNYLTSVDIIDSNGTFKTIKQNNLEFQYRSSSFSASEFIISARFKLEKSTEKNIKQKKKIASEGRIRTQPLKFRSAGSVFKNPSSKLAAGFLIDKSGLKGTVCGNAQISTHHANFFINHGNAKAKDISHLIKLTRRSIFERFGILLDLEIKTIGFEDKELFPYD